MIGESQMEAACAICGGAHPTGACFEAASDEEKARTEPLVETILGRERSFADRLRGYARETALALSLITAALATGYSKSASADVGIELKPGATEFFRREAEQTALKKLQLGSQPEEIMAALKQSDLELRGTKIIIGSSRKGGAHLTIDLCGPDVDRASLEVLSGPDGRVVGVKGTSELIGGGFRLITTGGERGLEIISVPQSRGSQRI